MPVIPVKLFNLARMLTFTEGVGLITLAAPVKSYLSFEEAGAQNGDTITYAVEDGAHREMGRGLYSASNSTLTRNVLKSTNNDGLIDLSGGAQVAIMAAAEDMNMFENRGFTTGDIKTTYKTMADYGWLLMDDSDFGSTFSAATHADDSTYDLFRLFFDTFNTPGENEAWLLDDSGVKVLRGSTNVNAAWNAGLRMTLPRTLGRALACRGWGDGLTNRVLGQFLGAETKALAASEVGGHDHYTMPTNLSFMLTFGLSWQWGTTGWGCQNFIYATNATGGSESFSLMNPTSYLNVMICL